MFYMNLCLYALVSGNLSLDQVLTFSPSETFINTDLNFLPNFYFGAKTRFHLAAVTGLMSCHEISKY